VARPPVGPDLAEVLNHKSKKGGKEIMSEATELLNAGPGGFQRDADRFGASVDLRHSSGYEALMGKAFFRFFRNPTNCDGEEGEWKWTVRRVDGLVNLTAWKVKKEQKS